MHGKKTWIILVFIWHFTGMTFETLNFCVPHRNFCILIYDWKLLERHRNFQKNTWIIRMRDKNSLQDNSSNIHTSTARYVHELDRVVGVSMGVDGFVWAWGVYGSSCESVGVYGSLWGLWQDMEVYGNLWINMSMCPHSTEYCRNVSEIFPIFHCNWNIAATFLSNIPKYFIATLQF